MPGGRHIGFCFVEQFTCALFYIPHISDITQCWYLSFSFWFTSLSTIISSCIHVSTNGIIFFYGWVIFHCIILPHLLYPFICQWIGIHHHTMHKNKFKMAYKHKYKSRHLKLLEGIMVRVFFDINLTNVFLGQSPKAVEMKTKINKWILMTLTSFWTVWETKSRQPVEWEKVFANVETNLVTFKLMQSPRFILVLSLFSIPFSRSAVKPENV